MKSLLHAMLGILLADITVAQEKPAARQLRLLAVGDMPPFRQEIRDGVRYELEPAPGTVPPRQIQIPLDEETSLDATLTLGSLTAALKAPGGAKPLILQAKHGEKWLEWHKTTLPESGDCLVVLWRDPQKKTWDAARSTVVADDATAFPAGTVRLMNLLPTSSRFVFAERTIDVKAGAMLVLPLPVETAPVQIRVLDTEQNWRSIFQSAISQGPGERGNVILYRADGVSPRSPVKVLMLRERAPAVK
jgi:hypothetical protein